MKVTAGPGDPDDGRLDRLTNYSLPFQAALAQIMPRRRHLTLADAIHIVDSECDKWGVHRPERPLTGLLARRLTRTGRSSIRFRLIARAGGGAS
jgi:hypothetical protein